MNSLKLAFKNSFSDRGFVLPIALAMGTVMILVGVAAVARSQQTLLNAIARKQTAGGGSLTVAEGGIARTLAQLTKANNSVLLTRNYDSINPKTNKTYLGVDGILNNGDEENTLVDEWANASSVASCGATPETPDATYNGIIGNGNSYTLKAYRYNNTNGTGTLLIEGKRKTSVSLIKVIVTVDSIAGDFPGVVAFEKMELRGRDVTGSNGNVYYDPAFSTNTSLIASAAPGDANRPDYLNAIISGNDDYPNDGDSVDNIEGKIVACKINPTFPYIFQGTNYLGNLNYNLKLFGSKNGISYYQAIKIQLKENKTVEVDTTAGAVYIYVNGSIRIEKNSLIRNVRTDGIPPRVGDLRIIISTNDKTEIKDTACIQNAFFYAPQGELQLEGSGNGCPSNLNSNIDGVVWAKEIINNSDSDLGIAVPDDISSLSDVANSTGLPGSKKFGSVKTWQRQQQ
ncbi:hypothetical protein [Chlorogloea sp. CCALA 695]|uniref:hypothetical protein n=1 Tax=Chlorogloea sp. CCALA 695 TaxID=2107693 RepID=UPI000D0659C2|nr:hypothetical protein [Chlorogloea sp. CCALA 695]PSB35039.1 hypothetical protein C7B70_01925 [Chlorogloea sp. CCALA 695]